MKNFFLLLFKIQSLIFFTIPSWVIGYLMFSSVELAVILSLISMYYGWKYVNDIQSIKKTITKLFHNKFLNDIIESIKPILSPIVNLFSGERRIMINKEEQFLHDVVRWTGPFIVIGFGIFILFSDAKNLPPWLLTFLFLGLIFIFKSAVSVGFEKSNDENYDKKTNEKLKNWSIKDTIYNTPIARFFRGIRGKESVEEIFNPITSQIKKSKTDNSSEKKDDKNLFCGNCGRKKSKYSIKFCTSCGNEFKIIN